MLIGVDLGLVSGILYMRTSCRKSVAEVMAISDSKLNRELR